MAVIHQLAPQLKQLRLSGMLETLEVRQLMIFNALGEMVAQHRKLPGRYKRVIVSEHYAGLPVLARSTSSAQALQMPPSAAPLAVGLEAPQVETRPLSVYAQLSEVHYV